MKKVICIGSATKDVLVPLDEVMVINNPSDPQLKKMMAFEYGAKIYADRIFEMVGGSAVNVASGLAKTGLKAFVFSRTDKGETGKWITKKMAKLKVKKNHLQHNGKVGSEVSVVICSKKSVDHFILRTGDSVENFNLEKALSKFREKIDWIFLASQKKDWEKNLEKTINFAEKKNAKLAFNPSSYQIKDNPLKTAKYLKNFEVVFLNRDEAIELAESNSKDFKDEPKYLLKKIGQMESRVVVITDAENGAYLWSIKTGMIYLGISDDPKVESTGAGDAFASGFLASYINSEDPREALAWGIANSGSSVAQIGSTAGLLSQKELGKKAKELELQIKTI